MNLMKVRILLTMLLATFVAGTSAANWTDITNRYVVNAGFDNGTAGWNDELNAGTKGISQGCMRFFNGGGRLTQQLTGLVKGRYRLRVQGFYRPTMPEDAYPAWQTGSEQTVAYLVAGGQQQKLKSLYEFSRNYNSGSCWTSDGSAYYPDGSAAATSFFSEGLYWNELEFEAEGVATIGIVCEQQQYNNWCVFDNFVLEYSTGDGAKSWVDVTSYLVNPGMDSNEGWTVVSNATSQDLGNGCKEFWNGTFDIWQTVSLPSGHYRLKVQAFYRCKDNYRVYSDGENYWTVSDYLDYINGEQNITGYMYAGETSKQLRSVYSDPSSNYINGCWFAEDKYYPDNMYSASVFFGEGRYWNEMEFDGGGDVRIGLRCQQPYSSNWCIFDNFKLEYYTDMVSITGITVKIAQTNLVVGEVTTATAMIEPATATLPFVTWTTGNPDIIKIDNNGNITAVGPGRATVWAFAADGSGVSASANVTVEQNAATVGSFVINEIMPSNVDEFISPAFNFDGWVELYNPTNRAVELGGVKVSDPADPTAVWTMPQTAGVIPAKGYKVVWFDSNDGNPNNVPFKLDTDGGTIVFKAANGQTIASQDYPLSLERVSYARSADNGGTWGYCGTPTPDATNNGTILLSEQIDAPIVDQPSQLFQGSLTIKVAIPSGCTLRYTVDGKLPTLTNSLVSSDGRFTIDNTRCFRFRLFADGKLPSRVTTRSYIYNDRDYYLPVVSVVTDEDFLYDTEIGVFAKGPNGRPGNGQSSNCNWNMNWERPVNFSFLTPDGKMALNQDVNLEMCGGWSRADTPHSFKLKGSKEMGGDKNLPYPFFGQKPYIRNRTLQIRNGGGDVWSGRFKDPALQYILMSSGVDVDGQSYEPVHEFINGQYMGLLNMREPNNKHYVYANYGWDEDEIDLFEMSPDSGYVQKCGTPDAFRDLVALSADAANAGTYAEICRLLDIDAYINYMAAELYLSSWDWPQNNVKGFRHRDNGRFRFVIFDLDAALSFYSDGKIWGTPPFQTFFNKEYNYTYDQLYPSSLGRITADIEFVRLFRQLLQNEDFRRRFIDAYCIMGGSVFERNRVSAVIDELLERVITAHYSSVNSGSNIRNQLGNHLDEAIQRIRENSHFELSSSNPQQVTLSSDTEGARLFINNQVVPTGYFNGQLFGPVTLRAEAPAGYAFKSWKQASGSELSTRPEITMSNSSTVGLTATFRQLTAAEKQKQGITPVRINEVSAANDSYIDEYGKKGDWLELYNTTSSPVDVEGMYLTDNAEKPTKYQITRGNTKAQTVIPAHGYLVIWCDNKRETSDNGLHANFKLSDDGGLVMLSAADRSWKDVLNYNAHDARTTVGRYPDGAASVYAMNVATIGKGNVMSSYVAAVEQTGVPETPSGLMAVTASDLRVVYGSGMLLAKNNQDGPVTVEVFRGDGVQVLQTTANVQSGTARVSVTDLPTGFYVARITTENGATASCRFVK